MISKTDARNGSGNGHGTTHPKKDRFAPNPRRRKGERNIPVSAKGMTVARYFTRVGAHPFDQVDGTSTSFCSKKT